ncbi:MAG: hypothetical protein AAF567_21600 [Actinomycetota bacterium]
MRHPSRPHPRQKRGLAILLATVMLLTGFVLTPATADAQGTPFGCDPGFYQVIAGQLNEFDPATDYYTPIGVDGPNYNGIGYRPADGFAYGSRSGKLIRLDGSGVITELGQLDRNYYTGDFGDDGLLHLSRGGRNWIKVDVDTGTYTSVPGLDGNWNVNDIANVNGKFYGVAGNHTLYIFDPVTETVTNGGTVAGIAENGVFGAAWSTAGGNLYIGQNKGPIYQVTGYSNGNPVAHRVATAQATNSNDGTSCPYAPPPPGIRDVDGATSETAPSTPEGAAAQATWEDDYEEQQEAVFDIPDAGLGEGPSCDPTTDEDRLPRQVVSASQYSAPTTIFNSHFDSGHDYLVISGSWEQTGSELRQVRDCGYDYTALLQTPQVANFRFETSIRGLNGLNQGGIVFNVSSEVTRSGAMVVDLADAGSVVRWGTYDDTGYYQYLGASDVQSQGTDILAVTQIGNSVEIEFNGEVIVQTTTANPGGYVGLLSSVSAVGFDYATVTALPAA